MLIRQIKSNFFELLESPNFIEEQTSESTIVTYEYSNVTLECYASGKPTPIIKWYQIDKERDVVIGKTNKKPKNPTPQAIYYMLM